MDIKDVTKNLNKPVLYAHGRSELNLILSACILRVKDGKYYYQAELKDKTDNSIVIVPLEKVETIGG